MGGKWLVCDYDGAATLVGMSYNNEGVDHQGSTIDPVDFGIYDDFTYPEYFEQLTRLKMMQTFETPTPTIPVDLPSSCAATGSNDAVRGAPPTKVIGGTTVDINNHPWFVSMTFLSKDQVAKGDLAPRGYCGATIIDSHHIITDKYCCTGQAVFGRELRNFGGLDSIFLHFGEDDFATATGSEFTYTIHGDDMIENQIRTSWAGWCLITLDIDIINDTPTSTNVDSLCMATQDADNYHGKGCWVVGFGEITNTPDNPAVIAAPLQELGVNVLSSAYCNLHTPYDFGYVTAEGLDEVRNTVWERNFCVGEPDRDGDGLTDYTGPAVCRGDGGSPIICENNGRLELIGILNPTRSEDDDYEDFYDYAESNDAGEYLVYGQTNDAMNDNCGGPGYPGQGCTRFFIFTAEYIPTQGTDNERILSQLMTL